MCRTAVGGPDLAPNQLTGENLGELILAASEEPRKLSIMLLDEVNEKMLRVNKKVRKEKEISERSLKDETIIEIPAGKRVRIVMTVPEERKPK